MTAFKLLKGGEQVLLFPGERRRLHWVSSVDLNAVAAAGKRAGGARACARAFFVSPTSAAPEVDKPRLSGHALTWRHAHLQKPSPQAARAR